MSHSQRQQTYGRWPRMFFVNMSLPLLLDNHASPALAGDRFLSVNHHTPFIFLRKIQYIHEKIPSRKKIAAVLCIFCANIGFCIDKSPFGSYIIDMQPRRHIILPKLL
jgi:hypothetical protein